MKVSSEEALALLNKRKTASSQLFMLLLAEAIAGHTFAVLKSVSAENIVLVTAPSSQLQISLADVVFEYVDGTLVSDLLPGIEFVCCLSIHAVSKAFTTTIYVLSE